MSDYYVGRLDGWVNAIISLAIRADMERNGYLAIPVQDPNCDPNLGPLFEFTRVGYFITPGDRIRSWQDGDTGDVKVELSPAWGAYDENNEVFEFNPYQKVYLPWITAIRSVFAPWRILPEADDFTPQLARLDTALTELCPGISSGGTSEGGSGSNIKNFKGVGPIPNLMDDIVGQLGSMLSGGSTAVDTFYENYVNDYSGVNAAQFEVAAHLKLAIAAQKELWTRTRADVLSIAIAGFEAMGGAGREESGGDNGVASFVFTVVGTLTAAASLVVTEGAAAAVIGPVATINGLLAQFWPTDDGDDDAELPPMGSADPQVVLDNIVSALNELDDKIYAVESDSYQALTSVEQAVGAATSPFRLGPPRIIRETDPTGNNLVQRNLLEIYPQKLHRIGMQKMPAVAGHVKTAAKHLTVGAGPWTRDHQGMVPTGPWPIYNAVAETLENVLLRTSHDLVDAGETLDDIGKLFDHTDQAVAGLLREHRQEVVDSADWRDKHPVGVDLPEAPEQQQSAESPDTGDTNPSNEGHPH